MKAELHDELSILLLRQGYAVKSLRSSCFDILARKGRDLLLIKVLADANAISKRNAEEMKRTASYFGAASLIVSEHANSKLGNSVVYERHGMFALNLSTIERCLNHKFPVIASDSAGLSAAVDGPALRKLREEKGLSLKRLSRKIGVSRTMIQRYEKGSSKITLARAKILYNLFGYRVFREINIFLSPLNKTKETRTLYSKHFEDIGFDASDFSSAPFDIVAESEGNIILTEIGDKVNAHLNEVAKLAEANNLVIFRKKKPRRMPSLSKKEFLDYERARELIKFVGEFE